MSFEDDLRSALRREPAPADFAAKVMAAIPRQQQQRGAIAFPRRPATLALAAGLAIAAIVPSAVSEYRRRREERAMEAERQLIVALRITSIKLKQTREKIQRSARRAL